MNFVDEHDETKASRDIAPSDTIFDIALTDIFIFYNFINIQYDLKTVQSYKKNDKYCYLCKVFYSKWVETSNDRRPILYLR